MKIYTVCEHLAGDELLRRVFSREGVVWEGALLRNENGKPYLPHGGAPFFNLTHTEGFSAAAFSAQAVGIDAERRRKVLSAIKKRLSPAEREEDFFELWTAKEAYVKYLGSSLAKQLPTLRYEGGFLYGKDERLPVFLRHFCFGDVVLCVCAAQEEPIEFSTL